MDRQKLPSAETFLRQPDLPLSSRCTAPQLPRLELGPISNSFDGTVVLSDPPEDTWANLSTLFPSDRGSVLHLSAQGLPILLTKARHNLPEAALVAPGVDSGIDAWTTWAAFEEAASTWPRRAFPDGLPAYLWDTDSLTHKPQPRWLISLWERYCLPEKLLGKLQTLSYDVALAIIVISTPYYQHDPLVSVLLAEPFFGEYKGTSHYERIATVASLCTPSHNSGLISLSSSTDICLRLEAKTFTWKAELALHSKLACEVVPLESGNTLTEEQWAQVAAAAADQHLWDGGFPGYTHLPSDSSRYRIQLVCEAVTRIDDFHDLFRDLAEGGTRGPALWYFRQRGAAICKEHYLPQLLRTLRLLANLLAYAECGSDVAGLGSAIMYTYFKSRTKLPPIISEDITTLQKVLSALPTAEPSTVAEEFSIPARPGFQQTVAGIRLRETDPAGSTGTLPESPWPRGSTTKNGLVLRDKVASLLGTEDVGESELGKAYWLLWEVLGSKNASQGADAVWWLISNPVNGISLRCCAIWRLLDS